MNHRNRTWSFAAAFLTLCSHVWLQQLSPWLYSALALSFLVWPQLAYVRAQHASNSMGSEFDNLVIDSAIFGLWIAGLAYPVWITFILVISTTVNLMVYRGPRGLLQALAGLAAGIVTASLFTGVHVSPQTHGITTALAASSISLYLLMVGYVSFTRNQVLHDARKQQRSTELELKQQIVENRQLQERLQEQVNRDPLTGLYNRRYLEDSLPREMARSKRQGAALSLVLIDLDHFKSVNDRYGHSAGDRVINQLAGVLARLSRASDIVCRFGGEEFLVVMPGTGLDAAEARAEEYRRAIEGVPVAVEGGNLSVTLSAGVACSHRDITQDALIRLADQALYRAKAQGRNRVISAPPLTDEPQIA